MNKLDRCWALAKGLSVSLNTICQLEFYGLVLDDGERARLHKGMSYDECLYQMRIVATLREECGGVVPMRPTGHAITRSMTTDGTFFAEQ